eukprot:CAMPEP_0174322038 /NCGR_PEP_ID=MMETSP0810-20121108/10770_1 /TAXON_ID=73025 ORGANISM="Eutreptiella gymnastica-like, Strain CCMP1594" /NCGR_SAMPLE_ID=MMETSP0810 /ASSEMBLY_ACC=CAM_ASM_000659 /LENGTH=132 /DNA_ID=CAMNT_0015433791 /DNA_START=456 /DNA_END=853 /DNA_ORIENTATION=+
MTLPRDSSSALRPSWGRAHVADADEDKWHGYADGDEGDCCILSWMVLGTLTAGRACGLLSWPEYMDQPPRGLSIRSANPPMQGVQQPRAAWCTCGVCAPMFQTLWVAPGALAGRPPPPDALGCSTIPPLPPY